MIVIHYACGAYRLWSTREGAYFTAPMDADACAAHLATCFPRGAVRSLSEMIAAARDGGTSQLGHKRSTAEWDQPCGPAKQRGVGSGE